MLDFLIHFMLNFSHQRNWRKKKAEQFFKISILEWQNWSKHQFCQNCLQCAKWLCLYNSKFHHSRIGSFSKLLSFFVTVSLARENLRGNLKLKNRTYPGFQHFHQQHCCHHQEFQWNTWLWPHFLKVYFLQYQAKNNKKQVCFSEDNYFFNTYVKIFRY